MQTHSPAFHFSPASIATVAGPVIQQTETTLRFALRPEIVMRLENGKVTSWSNIHSGRGGGTESLARLLGVALPPSGRAPGFYGQRRLVR